MDRAADKTSEAAPVAERVAQARARHVLRCRVGHPAASSAHLGEPGEWRQTTEVAGDLFCVRCGCFVQTYRAKDPPAAQVCWRCAQDLGARAQRSTSTVRS